MSEVNSIDYFKVGRGFVQIMKFAQALGWEDVEMRGRCFKDEMFFEFAEHSFAPDELCIQIILLPVSCIIYDIPHTICTGRFRLDMTRMFDDLKGEVSRYAPVFAKQVYESQKGRRQLKKIHPEFFGYSWREAQLITLNDYSLRDI